WTWVVNSLWSDPLSDPAPYYPGDAYVDWVGLDSYNWGRNPAQPDKWTSPEQTLTPTLKAVREIAPSKPVAIVENAASEYGGNKADWIREMLTTYLPHHPEIKAYLWFNWNFPKGSIRSDWPIESSPPAQQQFRKAIQSGAFVSGPVSLPALTKVPPPASGAGPAQPGDLSPAAEMAGGPDLAIASDGTATAVWSAREGSGSDFAVFARRIGFDGSAGPVHRLSAPGEDALAPRVALAPDGTATVVWMRSDGADFRIQTRRIGADGTPEETTLTLSGATQDAMAPQVAVAPDGAATVVWKRFDGFHYLVQARRIAADGTSPGAAQRLSEPKQDAVEPTVAVVADGTATVVWSRFDGADSVVQTRRVEADGTLEASIEDLSAAGESAIEPRLALGPGGEATVVWNRFDGANWIVQARRLLADGEAEAGTVNLSAPGRSAAEPQLALDPAGRATVLWSRFDGSGFVVQARRLDAAGTPEGAAVNLSAAGADAADPRLAVGEDGTASVLWSRFDGSRWIVQRRDLAPAGALGAVENLSSAGWSSGDAALARGAEGTLTMVWRRFDEDGDAVQAKTVPGPRPPLPPPPPPPEPPTSAGSPLPGAVVALPPVAVDGALRIERVRLDRRRGTATLVVKVPGPGALSLSGALPRPRLVPGASTVDLRVVPLPGKRRLLRQKGVLRLRVTVHFAPLAGAASKQTLTLRLRRSSP
ncbi:MAG TPA: hypothetical protein VD741_05700, partial [Solirubrobacterales bacterium]|nr:hypothetical protein [Solirubrobacterales bacterium]